MTDMPPEKTRAEAARILMELDCDEDMRLYSDEGSAVIEINRNPHGAFLLRVEPDNQAFCVVVNCEKPAETDTRSRRYPDASVLPDKFVEEGLREVLCTKPTVPTNPVG